MGTFGIVIASTIVKGRFELRKNELLLQAVSGVSEEALGIAKAQQSM
jgi:hypothetical protein